MSRLPPRPRELVIHPSRLALEQALARAPGAAVAAGAHVTFNTLFGRVGAPAGRRHALPLASWVLVREVLAAGDDGWRALAHDPLAVRAVQRALAELREAGVTAGHLRPHAPSPGLGRLAAVLGGYERALDDLGLFDDADRAREAVLAAARGGSPALAGIERVRVEGGGSLFGARWDFLSALAARGVSVVARVPYDPARKAAFAWPEASLHRIEASGERGVALAFDDRAGSGPLAALRRAVLGSGEAPGAPVRVVEASSHDEHAHAVARAVTGWLRAGVPAHQIAVACADLDELGGATRRALAAAGVATRLRRGVPLAGTRAASALAGALRLPDRGFPREGLVDLWLALGRWIEGPRGRLSPASVASRLREAGVRSVRVGGYRERLLARSRASRRPDEAAATALVVADELERLMDLLSRVPADGAPAGQVAALAELAQALGSQLTPEPPWRLDDPAGAGPPGLLRAAAIEREAVRALHEVVVALGQAFRVGGGATALSRRELADLFDIAASDVRLRTEGGGAAAVTLLAPGDLVETRFSRVALVGVDPEVFPAARAVDPVLTEDLRAEVNARLGPRLLQVAPMSGRGVLRADARDLWSWVEALASAQEELLVTYTRPEGSAAGRSELCEDLARALGGSGGAAAVAAEPVEPFVAVASDAHGPELAEPVPALDGHGLDGAGLTLAPAGRRTERAGVAFAPAGRGGEAAEPFDLPGARLAWATARRFRAGDAAVRGLGAALARVAPGALESIGRRIAVARALEARPFVVAPLPSAERASLARHLEAAVQTTSDLDALGTCAFRYFAKSVLHLAAADVGALGPDAREEGTLAHAALEIVYTDVLASGGLAAARRDPVAARERARRALDVRRERLVREASLHPWLEPAAVDAAVATALRQLDADLARDGDREPLALEHRFDDRPGGAPPLVLDAPDGSLTLTVRGSIDRVDRVGDRIEAIDYKRTPEKREPGRHFQLPIYLAVAARDFGAGASELAASWVGLRDARPRVAVEPGPPDVLSATLAQDLFGRLGRVLAGDVSPDPDRARACARCDFAALCRLDAVADEGGDA